MSQPRKPRTESTESVVSTEITRRGFVNGAATAAAAAALVPHLGCTRFLHDDAPVSADARVVPTACEVCPNKCAVLAVVEGGRIRKLNPNPASPKSRGMLCARGNAAVKVGLRPGPGQAAADPGRRARRGQVARGVVGRGVRLRRAALTEIKEQHGPEAVIWSSTEGFQEEFFKNLGLAFGSPNILRHPTLCLASVNLAYSMTFGTVPSFDLLNADYVIMSGANRFESIITPDTMDLIDVDDEPQGAARLPRPALHGDRRQGRRVVPDPAGSGHGVHPGAAPRHHRRGALRQGVRRRALPRLRGAARPRAALHAGVGGRRDRDPGAPTSPASPASSPTPRRAPLYYAGRRSSWYSNDFQMRRAQAILNAIVGSWDREGGVVPNSKIALGEYLFMPWDEPTAPRVDEIDTRFPLAAKGDGVFLQARENVLAGRPYPVKGWMVYKQDPMSALPDRGAHPEDDRADGLRRGHRHPDERHRVVRRRGPPRVDLPRAHRPAAHAAGDLAGGGDAAAGDSADPRHQAEPRDRPGARQATRAVATTSTTRSSSGSRRRPRSCRSPTPLEHLKKHGVSRGARGAVLRHDPASRIIASSPKSGKIELVSERLAEAGHDPLPVYAPPAAAAGRARSAWCSAARPPTPTPPPPTTCGSPS